MTLKIDLKQKEYEALRAWLASDQNRIQAPSGYHLVDAEPDGSMTVFSQSTSTRFANEEAEPMHNGDSVTATIEVLDLMRVIKQGTTVLEIASTEHLLVGNTPLSLLFASIHRFPAD